MVASEMIEQKLKVNTSWSISVKTDQRKFQETIIITIIVITIITIEIRNIFNRLTCIQRRQCRSSGYSYTVLSHRLPSLQIYLIQSYDVCDSILNIWQWKLTSMLPELSRAITNHSPVLQGPCEVGRWHDLVTNFIKLLKCATTSVAAHPS